MCHYCIGKLMSGGLKVCESCANKIPLEGLSSRMAHFKLPLEMALLVTAPSPHICRVNMCRSQHISTYVQSANSPASGI